MIERPLKAYPIDPQTQEGPTVLLKIEAGDGPVWIQGSGFLYFDAFEDNRTKLLFETGGRLVRPRAFAFLEEA